MTAQSTRHLLMIEPAKPGFNPETEATNDYQIDEREDPAIVSARYIQEFRDYRDALVTAGIFVTTLQGPPECLDAGFPNWFSVHDGGLIVYPMLTPNRNAERMPNLIATLEKRYGKAKWFEGNGKALEGVSSLVLDRVNKIAYACRSARTDDALARKWADDMGYELQMFDALDHHGKPVYHTDLTIWIGSTLAGVCSECIVEKDRARIVDSLRRHREIVEFDNHQLRSFCGNALEALGKENRPVFIVSQRALDSMRPDQIALLRKHFSLIVTARIPTVESYGGGSARCMLQELF